MVNLNTGALGLAALMSVGCGPDYWKETFECNPEIQGLVQESKALINTHRYNIEAAIEQNVRPDLQVVSPSEVLDRLLYGNIPINCGTPTTFNENNAAVFMTEPYFGITLNQNDFNKRASRYERGRDIIDGTEFTLNRRVVEGVMYQLGPFEGEEEARKLINDYFHPTYFAIGVLVHEFTHAELYLNGHPWGHESFDGKANDPVIQYQAVARETYHQLLIEDAGLPQKINEIARVMPKKN